MKNYRDLTAKLLSVIDDVDNDKMPLQKAQTIVKAANAVSLVQRAKIASTKVTGDKRIQFFED